MVFSALPLRTPGGAHGALGAEHAGEAGPPPGGGYRARPLHLKATRYSRCAHGAPSWFRQHFLEWKSIEAHGAARVHPWPPPMGHQLKPSPRPSYELAYLVQLVHCTFASNSLCLNYSCVVGMQKEESNTWPGSQSNDHQPKNKKKRLCGFLFVCFFRWQQT